MYQQFALSTSQALLAFEWDDDTLRLSVREANHNHKVPKAVSALPVEYAPRFTQAGLQRELSEIQQGKISLMGTQI